MNVVTMGDSSLAQEIIRLSTGAGHQIKHVAARLSKGGEKGGSLADDLAGCDVVIELENASLEAKRAGLQALSQSIPDETLILSLAFATSATEAASWISHPERLVGIGLLPPLSAPGIVELGPGFGTDDAYVGTAADFWLSLGLEPVVVADGPGLVRARTVCCLVNEAASALMEQVASADDIDTAMRLGTNYPYGPLEWADMIGLDNVLAVVNGLFHEWGEDRYRPSPLLRRMVLTGWLGQKTGRGFFTYDQNGKREAR